eukprot:TRINITY_DN668_c0_g1_i3.p1 TRINITY_DN668_c0_g1~~TRINITY_DN668_c0_g1_i3.p1  ORF type:complete len:210 (-),score=24.15 TRINITY_DN668_c0_g1_i3:113-742(-)
MGCGANRASKATNVVQEPEKTGPLPQEKPVISPKKEPEVKQEPKEKIPAKPNLPKEEKIDKPKEEAPAEPKPSKEEKVEEPMDAPQDLAEKDAQLYGFSADEVQDHHEAIGQMKMGDMRNDGKRNIENFQVSIHPHRLYLFNNGEPWFCDASVLPDGCMTEKMGIYSTRGLKRYTCKVCDYDLCEKCVQKYLVEQMRYRSKRYQRIYLN